MVSYCKLGDVEQTQGRLDTGERRKQWLRVAHSVWSWLSEQHPDDDDYARRRDEALQELEKNP